MIALPTSTVSASVVDAAAFNIAPVRCELAGLTRTNSCDLNLGSWEIAPADRDGNAPIVAYWVSLTTDGREFKIYRFEDRADALTWVDEVCGHVNWVEM
ncbi:hypothetical protein ACSHWG_00830 [Leucobacter sp. Z1108]|uniref:hypothetical protein n=1 Tax=Leucobacter sp. Z1108 TaxID=3439066 RepID=UPI003F35E533